VIGSIMCAASGLSAIILPGVAVSIGSSPIGIVASGGAPAGAHAESVNARASSEKIITFFIFIFPLKSWNSP